MEGGGRKDQSLFREARLEIRRCMSGRRSILFEKLYIPNVIVLAKGRKGNRAVAGVHGRWGRSLVLMKEVWMY